ncbi:MAG: carbohydrate ABC transporter permease [Spirochaetes bacterium]|nr:carbohydrate ABC transporter permease [Spirochaetota bacterium]
MTGSLSYKAQKRANTAVTEIALVLSSIVIIFPFFWMIVTAFKSDAEIYKVPLTILPQKIYLENFRELISDAKFLRYYLNSSIVAVVGTVLSTFSSLAAGFVFAKFRFPFKKTLFFLVLATLMIPFQCYIIPLYLFSVKLKLIDTYTGLIFPIVISSFGIFFIRQNMQAIPDEMIEAAKIDGASLWRTFFAIIVPLSASSAVALAIFQFMTAWGDFMWPLVITNSQKMFVLELGLTRFRGQFVDDYGLMMSGAALGIIPVIIVFLIFRRYIIEGTTLSGIKA